MSNESDHVGLGINDEEDGRSPSCGPTFPDAYPVHDSRGNSIGGGPAVMHATFDNGAERDMETGEVFHRFRDH